MPIEKASLKKYKMTTVDLAKADQLNKANTEFQFKCSTVKPAAGAQTAAVTPAAATAAKAAAPVVAAKAATVVPVKAPPIVSVTTPATTQ